MQDMVIKGTGNSRFLKSVENFLDLFPNYEAFATAFASGVLPVDFNGINPDGITQMGTPYAKSAVLTDETAALFGLDETAVPDDVFFATNRLIREKSSFRVGHYVGTGAYGEGSTSITFNTVPELVIMLGYTDTDGNYTSVFGNFRTNGDTLCVVFPKALTAEYKVAPIFFEGGHGMGWAHTTHYGKFDQNTLYWYNTIGNSPNGAPSVFNKAGYTYYYMYFYN